MIKIKIVVAFACERVCGDNEYQLEASARPLVTLEMFRLLLGNRCEYCRRVIHLRRTHLHWRVQIQKPGLCL